MESLVAILTAACLIVEVMGRHKLSRWLFALALLLAAFTFHLHTTSTLNLEF